MSSQTLAETIDLVDISSFLEKPTASDDCNKIAQSLKETGAVLIRDARVTEEHSSMFLNLMERYFAQPSEMKIPDARPELSHQVWPIYSFTPLR